MTMGLKRYAKLASLAATGAIAMILGGCGGNSSVKIVNVRTVDDIPNGGNASIEVNNGTVSGAQTYFSVTSYHYLQPTSATITLELSVTTLTYPTTYASLLANNYYSVYGIGNALTTDSTATGYPSTVVLQDDSAGAPAGDVKLRFLAAAPDAGPATITVNGATVATSVAYGGYTSYATYTGASPAVTIAGTSLGGSTSSTLVSKTLSLSAGHSYTLLMDEPTPGSGSYDIETVTDH